MGELIRQQRHFLQLLIQTTSAQRKAILHTITKSQLKAVSEIAYNILKFKIPLTASQKTSLKRQRRVIYLLGNRKVGFQQKKEGIQSKEKLVYKLIKIASVHLGSVLE